MMLRMTILAPPATHTARQVVGGTGLAQGAAHRGAIADDRVGDGPLGAGGDLKLARQEG